MCQSLGGGASTGKVSREIFNRYEGMSTDELLEESRKKVKAMSVLKQNNKKVEDILSGKAYYSETIKEQARNIKAQNDAALDILQAEYDVISRIYDKKRSGGGKAPIYMGR